MPPASLRAPLDPVQALYREHHGWLLALLRRRLRCPDGAADLAHDTFVRVLLRPEVLPGLREPRAYLTTIARGLLHDPHWAWRAAAALGGEMSHPPQYIRGYLSSWLREQRAGSSGA